MTRWIWVGRSRPAPWQIVDDFIGVPDWLVVAFQGYALVVLFAGLLFLAFGAS
jgi:hypothetical protein